jgi:hypothetical protein
MYVRSSARQVLAALVAVTQMGCAGGEADEDSAIAERSATPENAESAMTPAEVDEPGEPVEAEATGMKAPEPTPPASGVEGRVTLGPRCPTVEVGVDCPDRPHSAELVIRDAESGAVVATLESDADGVFRLELEPGDYVLEAKPAQVVYAPSAQAVPFTVEPGLFTQVDMRFDSGVR